MEKLEERAREMERQWEQRLEAARYEAEKAARRYYQVEPENRQVARTVEAEWNARLEELERLRGEYEAARRKPPLELTPEQREKVVALAGDIPRLWRAPTTRNRHRKQIVRLLVEDVTLRNEDDPWGIEVAIRWRTGVVTRHRAARPVLHPQATAPQVVARIEALRGSKIDREIAEILNAEGLRGGRGRAFTEGSVAHIRRSRGWMKPRPFRRIVDRTDSNDREQPHEAETA